MSSFRRCISSSSRFASSCTALAPHMQSATEACWSGLLSSSLDSSVLPFLLQCFQLLALTLKLLSRTYDTSSHSWHAVSSHASWTRSASRSAASLRCSSWLQVFVFRPSWLNSANASAERCASKACFSCTAGHQKLPAGLHTGHANCQLLKWPPPCDGSPPSAAPTPLFAELLLPDRLGRSLCLSVPLHAMAAMAPLGWPFAAAAPRAAAPAGPKSQ